MTVATSTTTRKVIKHLKVEGLLPDLNRKENTVRANFIMDLKKRPMIAPILLPELCAAYPKLSGVTPLIYDYVIVFLILTASDFSSSSLDVVRC